MVSLHQITKGSEYGQQHEVFPSPMAQVGTQIREREHERNQ